MPARIGINSGRYAWLWNSSIPPGCPSLISTFRSESRPDPDVYLSGQVARNAAGEAVGGGDLAAQTEQASLNVATALDSVGAGFEDVAKLRSISSTSPRTKSETLAQVRVARLRRSGSRRVASQQRSSGSPRLASPICSSRLRPSQCSPSARIGKAQADSSPESRCEVPLGGETVSGSQVYR